MDKAVESIKRPEDVVNILPMLSSRFSDPDPVCPYMAAKTLHELAKNESYLPHLLTQQQFFQGEYPFLEFFCNLNLIPLILTRNGIL